MKCVGYQHTRYAQYYQENLQTWLMTLQPDLAAHIFNELCLLPILHLLKLLPTLFIHYELSQIITAVHQFRVIFTSNALGIFCLFVCSLKNTLKIFPRWSHYSTKPKIIKSGFSLYTALLSHCPTLDWRSRRMRRK